MLLWLQNITPLLHQPIPKWPTNPIRHEAWSIFTPLAALHQAEVPPQTVVPHQIVHTDFPATFSNSVAKLFRLDSLQTSTKVPISNHLMFASPGFLLDGTVPRGDAPPQFTSIMSWPQALTGHACSFTPTSSRSIGQRSPLGAQISFMDMEPLNVDYPKSCERQMWV